MDNLIVLVRGIKIFPVGKYTYNAFATVEMIDDYHCLLLGRLCSMRIHRLRLVEFFRVLLRNTVSLVERIVECGFRENRLDIST